MTEVLFILIVIFIAYVIYVAVSKQKTTSPSPASQVEPEKPVAAVIRSIPRSTPKNEKVASEKSVASATSKPEPATASQDAGKRGIKDPKTGEV
ncbi:MAG: hypothetical protein WAW61_07885, partial [Methylococcaceae bacterium]